MRFAILICAITAIFFTCEQRPEDEKSAGLYSSQAFKDYWYAGKAEILSFDLDQVRYGENHKGNAVLIFVTEGFSKDKHVKLDNPAKKKEDEITVMKLNFTKKFVTGIYPYSMMLSCFTPVNHNQYPNTLKTTMSSQEWCGHTFCQLNLLDNQIEVHSYSYFEKEGDSHYSLDKVLLEDEIWNIIRLDHSTLPIGSVQILPGLFSSRLNHSELKPELATATKRELDSSFVYVVNYNGSQRELGISFEKTFPYKIISWEEILFEKDGQLLKTTGTLSKTLITDYWRKNKNEHRYLRDSLDLNPDF